jgi:hypothetical protein
MQIKPRMKPEGGDLHIKDEERKNARPTDKLNFWSVDVTRRGHAAWTCR